MKTWIKAYWVYRLEKSKTEQHIYHHFPSIENLVTYVAIIFLIAWVSGAIR